MSGPVLPPLAEEDVLEVGEGLFVVGELADEGVGVEPDELALLVVGLAAHPVGPGGLRRGRMLAAMAVSSVLRQSRPGL